ncbi:MAG TPA: ATP-binding protein [Longimicrobium sp.]|jgi:signal transduction histidine kinase|uniref:PAS domain-containing sensor histidine kinase n=1 Tax=Longimicrobium sp. TaxID=2029185 RepID=UPI002EDBB679
MDGPDFRSLFEAAPGLFMVMRADAPRYTIVAASDAHLAATLSTRDGPRGIIGRGIFEAFPDPPSDPGATGMNNVRASLERVIASGVPDVMPVQQYAVRRADGTWEERHWSPVHSPVVDRMSGKVTHVIQRVDDVTAAIRLTSAHETLRGEHARSIQARHAAEDANAHLAVQGEALSRTNRQLRELAMHLETQAEALRRSEAKYRSLFDSIDQGFFVTEMLYDAGGRAVDYRYVEANPAFTAQTGLADPVGRTAREMVPLLEDKWIQTAARVAATGQSIRFQSDAKAMGRWFDVFAFRAGAPEDRRVAMLFADVTARRAMEHERETLVRELMLERARLEDVFRQAPASLAVLRGADHVFDLVNDAFYELVGRRDLLGKPAFEALPEVQGQGFRELLDQVLATGERFVGRALSLRVARTAGALPEERFIDLTYLPLIEADGRRAGIIAHGTDVTEQVLARREIERLLEESERARAEAEAANQAKSEFLAMMSHELRTPLNAIGGYTELIGMGVHGPVTPEQLNALDRIQRSQRALLSLINEVLNFARLETGTVQYALTDVPVAEAMTEAEMLVAPQLQAKRLGYFWAGCDPALTVRADREKLQQVLLNLLSNAVKFTDERAGVAGRVEVSCETQPAGRVQIRVRDSGLGIPRDKWEAVFEPFVQVDQRLTRAHEGTGLGLAISRDLTRGMDGDLTLESVPGVGSTFTITLPAGCRAASGVEDRGV